MKKTGFIFLVLCILAGANSLRAQYLSPKEMKAEAQLKRYLEKAIPARGLSLECILLDEPEGGPGFFHFAIREKHGGKCPGDPSTSPIIDRYRVLTNPDSIQRWDAAKNEWKPAPLPK